MKNLEVPKRLSPSLRRILLFILCIAIPIVLLGIGILLYSAVSAQKSAANRVNTAVSAQIEALDLSLSTANYYMVEALTSGSQIAAITAATDDHTRNFAARNLGDELDRQRRVLMGSFNFYYCYPTRNLSLSRTDPGTDYSDYEYLREQLKKQIEEGTVRAGGLLWQPIVVGDRVYLLQVYTYKGSYLASWIDCAKIFTTLQDIVLTGEGFYTVLDEAYAPLPDARILKKEGILLEKGAVTQKPWGAFANVFPMSRSNIGLLVADKPYINQETQLFLLAFLCLTLLIILAFAIYTLRYFRLYIEEPFQQLRDHIAEYASGRAVVKKQGFAELGTALEAFDALEKQLHNLKIDAYEEKLKLTKTELDYYQLQIKPHFFVNSLSILHGMAGKQDYARIQDFCVKLASYVRYLFRGSLSTVTVAEELRMIEEYLDIQTIRHRTGGVLQSETSSALLDCRIPPLILLSFAENAVKYAKTSETELVITVGASQREEKGELRLVLTLEDNGPGFPSEVLDAVNRIAQDPALTPCGPTQVGIRNIHNRLALLYGTRFSLVFSNRNGSAHIEITLPA